MSATRVAPTWIQSAKITGGYVDPWTYPNKILLFLSSLGQHVQLETQFVLTTKLSRKQRRDKHSAPPRRPDT